MKTTISFCCCRLFLIYCILSFASASFSTQSQSVFVFLQFEAGSVRNTLEFSNKVLLSKNQNHEVIFVRKKGKYIASFLFESKILKFIVLTNIYLFFQVFFSWRLVWNSKKFEFLSYNSIYKTPALIKNCFLKMLIPCRLLWK